MPADQPLSQAIVEQLHLTIGGAGVRATTIPRLALLVLGLLAGRTCVLSQMAAEVWALRVTRARSVEAGWRTAALVAYWEFGQQTPLVVATSLRPSWDVLEWSGRRFWIEAEFRSEQALGWQWEAAQIHGIAHHERLLVAMAWATLLVVCLGLQVARSQLARVTQRTQAGHPPPAPRRPRFSLFRLGLIARRASLYRRVLPSLRWSLPDPDGPSWADRWLLHHASLSAAA